MGPRLGPGRHGSPPQRIEALQRQELAGVVQHDYAGGRLARDCPWHTKAPKQLLLSYKSNQVASERGKMGIGAPYIAFQLNYFKNSLPRPLENS